MTTNADKRKDRPGDQPLPVPSDRPSIHDLVAAELPDYGFPQIPALQEALRLRKDLGLQRYGSLLQAHNGRDALQDLLEELLDAVVYAKQDLEETRISSPEGADRDILRRLGIMQRNYMSLIGIAAAVSMLMSERDGSG